MTQVVTSQKTLRTLGMTNRTIGSFKTSRADIIEDMSNITDEDKAYLLSCFAVAKRPDRSRKEASMTDKKMFAKQFLDAKKAEYQSWVDNDVFDIVDMRKIKTRNWVTGRWVLTVKRDKDGNFLKCKARWVLRFPRQTKG